VNDSKSADAGEARPPRQAPTTRRKQAIMNPNGNLERILESAVVIYWDDLMRDTHTGLIHIEYGFAADGTLDNLKVWSSLTRGHWASGVSVLDVSTHFTAPALVLKMDTNPMDWLTFWNLLCNTRPRLFFP
jgi:hypothetical protein